MIVFPIKIVDKEYVSGTGYFTKFWSIVDSRKVNICDCESKENADFVEKALNIYNNLITGTNICDHCYYFWFKYYWCFLHRDYSDPMMEEK